MAQRDFPLDPVQTQITRPVTNVTAAPVAPPQQTGLSEGLAIFGKAVGGVAALVKARKFDEELKVAELDAARGRVSVGLVSQAAIDKNYETLDMNFTNDLITQAKTWGENGGSNIANDASKTRIQKSDEIGNALNTYRDKLKYITHSGKALAKADLALKTIKYDLYTAIGQHDQQVVIAGGVKFVNDYLEGIAATEEGVIDVGVVKHLTTHLTELKQQDILDINGTEVRVATNTEEEKTVMSLVGSVVLAHQRDKPELYLQFLQVVEDRWQDMADRETAMRVQGKTSVVSDKTTFQAILDNINNKWDAGQKTIDEEEKYANDKWTSNKLKRLLAENPLIRKVPADELMEGGEIYERFRYNLPARNKFVSDMETTLKQSKYDKHSEPFFQGMRHVLTGQFVDEQQIENYGRRNNLSPDAIAALQTDLTEKRTDIQRNIDLLKERTPVFTWAHIHSALKTAKRGEYISNKLNDLNISLKTAVDLTSLQGLVSASNNLLSREEILGPLKQVQDYIRETRSLRDKLARDAAYRYDGQGRDVSFVTNKEIEDFVTKRLDKFNEVLGAYTLYEFKLKPDKDSN